MAGGVESDEQGGEAIPKPKPGGQSGKKKKKRGHFGNRKKLAKLDFQTGQFVKSTVAEKEFENYTVGELRSVVDGCRVDSPPGCVAHHWMDEEEFAGIFEDEGEADAEEKPIMACSWRSEPEDWNSAKWIKVDSVMDSGCFDSGGSTVDGA